MNYQEAKGAKKRKIGMYVEALLVTCHDEEVLPWFKILVRVNNGLQRTKDWNFLGIILLNGTN